MIAEGVVVLEDKKARRVFIRKVYLIFMIQFTFMLIKFAGLFYVPALRKLLLTFSWMYNAAWIRFLIATPLFLYCDKLRHKVPWNYICIILCIESMATVLAYIAFDLCLWILISLPVTVVIALASILITCKGIFDLTHRSRAISVMVIIALVVVVVASIIPTVILHYPAPFVGALVFSLCLLQCIQLILGQKYQYAFNEHLPAAVFLYFSVVVLIICLSNGVREIMIHAM